MDNKEYWDIDRLKEWENNPRNITPEGFERLKKQVKRLGQYKPLIVTKEGIVLGGNMRLKAYRELGLSKVWVSVVNPKDDNEMFEYALSDNDRAGFYDEGLLNKLLPEFDVDWSDYAVDLMEPMLIKDFLSSEEGFDGKNKEIDPNALEGDLNVQCPRCGFRFKHEES